MSKEFQQTLMELPILFSDLLCGIEYFFQFINKNQRMDLDKIEKLKGIKWR